MFTCKHVCLHVCFTYVSVCLRMLTCKHACLHVSMFMMAILWGLGFLFVCFGVFCHCKMHFISKYFLVINSQALVTRVRTSEAREEAEYLGLDMGAARDTHLGHMPGPNHLCFTLLSNFSLYDCYFEFLLGKSPVSISLVLVYRYLSCSSDWSVFLYYYFSRISVLISVH